MNSDKKWCITFLSLILCAMAALGAVTIIVDPFFHLNFLPWKDVFKNHKINHLFYFRIFALKNYPF